MTNVIQLATRQKGAKPPAAASADLDIVRRDQAVIQLRDIEAGIRAREGSACILAMDAGDQLAEFKDAAGHGRWLLFLQDCNIRPRRAQIYMLLASERATVEAANTTRGSHLSIAEALKLIRPKKPKPEQREPKAQDPVITTTIVDVLAWLPKACQADKRQVAVALAQDTAAMRAILPAKALPARATPEQIFKKAMAMLSVDETPPVTH